MKRLWLCLLLSGCSLFKAKADPTRYFVLTANDKQPATPEAVTIGLDKVDLPEYLVRDEMVSRTAANQLAISDYNRWGEPLRDGFVRTLRRDLEAELGMEHVLTQPFVQPPTLLLDLEVRHFEHVAGGTSQLDVTWTLRDKGTVVATHDTTKTEAAPDNDVGASVGALSKTMQQLASEIVEAIRARK